MLKRFPITLLLGLALLFSQGGVLLVASLCPHLRLAAPSCDMPKMESPMDHSQMAHHEMNHGSSMAIVIEKGQEPCSHCVIHSRSNSNGRLIRTTDTVKRSADLEVPVGVSVPPPVTLVAVAVLPREHGPPGKASRPKHVLNNTFRI